MSRIGKQPIAIPQGTQVSLNDCTLVVKGPKGELSRDFKTEQVAIKIDSDTITLTPVKSDIQTNALWGTYAAHISNMITGVNKMFEKKLVIEGIGFKAEVKGPELVMSLGFSIPVKMEIPKGITVVVEKGNMTISGLDIERVGEFAAKVRAKKKPEPYKGKGIRYHDEVIRRKQGKKTT
ncbi:MAG: 50S ribosomal protein L6 [Candidatus Paceibacterota bacterium]